MAVSTDKKEKVECPICHQKVYDLEKHNAATTKHDPPEDLTEEIEQAMQEAGKNLRIAKAIYDEVVVPICKANNLKVLPWDDVNVDDYRTVVEKIRAL